MSAVNPIKLAGLSSLHWLSLIRTSLIVIISPEAVFKECADFTHLIDSQTLLHALLIKIKRIKEDSQKQADIKQPDGSVDLVKPTQTCVFIPLH